MLEEMKIERKHKEKKEEIKKRENGETSNRKRDRERYIDGNIERNRILYWGVKMKELAGLPTC